MRKLFLFFSLVFLIGAHSCSVLDQAQEYQRFAQCDFSLKTVKVLDVNGIDVQKISKPEDIPMLQLMSLSQAVMSGSLPAVISIDLNARNNNTQKASISGMKWKIMLKENEFLSGVLDQSVEVQGNSQTEFPVKTNIDILKLAQSNSLNQVWDLVFADDKLNALREMGVSFQLKPMYKVGGEVIEHSSYIVIKP